ncbi:DNA mismatch repair protein MutL [Rhodovastum atsumiense]|uniref:DNA mismatch repair protein MutL n=1 Tax=Rhodovastum atsumiense TaxID=504468 RepID=A0A5M6IVQ0_9PROT|nr:DNA mismatch repair endonuclease MutL [Rhodovastum atsumiense]KAA5611495.1 DNA mismatch repair endonuclease MutL [Rhodovastum atsumiense]CAH2601191.1 DNA mismatch repair protein MutL [Rhodovastum atsumiense]
MDSIAGRIRLLPETTVNRIAAGEVIERPAAAVRELVENALDAGATRISVAIDGGGIDRIEVADDGIGMGPEELALAVLRHATSKLPDDDLTHIATLGFRGEALPSIGAAARLAITSRPRGAEAATIQVEGGQVGEVRPTSGAPGTRVVVRDLFYATPARRKFLKSARTEADAAEAAVRRLALAAPQVAMRFESDGRVAFDLPVQDRAARVAALLGPDAAAALLPVELARGSLRLSGFAAAPTVTRATAATQALVVNGRPVADPVLRTAVRVAYRDVIAYGRHAVVALFLEVPPEDLDVNVHPAKAEVRFREAESVRGLVISALSRALAGGAGFAMTPLEPRPAPPPPILPHSGRPWLNLTPGGAPRAAPAVAGLAEVGLPLGAAPAARVPDPAPERPAEQFPLGAPVAQVLDTYVLAVAADGALVVVDQHAAHERLTHETLRGQLLQGGVRTQPLLLPAVVDLAPADAARLLARAEELARLGLELEAFGPGAVLVRALPAALGAPDPAPLLRDLADELAEMDETTALEAKLDAVVARLACHGSIRAGRRLTLPEMDALLRQMEATPRAATCSHGRPTYLKLSRAEIERLFGRR